MNKPDVPRVTYVEGRNGRYDVIVRNPDASQLRINGYPREKLLDSVRRWMPETVEAVRAVAARFDGALVASGQALRTPLPAPEPA